MLVNETSRLSQLTEPGLTKLAEAMNESNLFFYAITKEIEDKINALPVAELYSAARWYVNAHQFAAELAEEFDTTIEVTAGVIAAISPRMAWLRNKAMARKVFEKLSSVETLSPLDAAKSFHAGLYSNFAMAVKIARGEDIANVLTGTKRRSFYNNIVSPSNGDSVTVDTWMVRAIMNTTGMALKPASDLLRKNQIALGGTGIGYYVIAECVRNVAKRMSLIPCQVQAVYWVSVSGSENGGREDIS